MSFPVLFLLELQVVESTRTELMRATPRFFLLLILLLSGCCVVGTAQESNESHFESEAWRFFRGNDFDGHSADGPLANEWPEKGPPVLWHIDLGVGYSGFVGKDGKVYTQYQSLTAQLVVCLDARTCLLYTSPSPRDGLLSRMPSSA